MTRTPARRAVDALRRLLLPEGAILAALLAAPWIPGASRLLPGRAGWLLALVAGAALILGWRFGRGRVVHGMFVLCAAALIPLLEGPEASLAALLVPLNLAALALLPDRGILTRGGLLRSAALGVQAAAVAAFSRLAPLGVDPLSELSFPGWAGRVDAPLVGYGVAMGVLALVTLRSSSASTRGALWAVVAALAAHSGYAGGAVYAMTAGGAMLVVAVLEDAYALAYRDALTGLPSRRALDELLERTARRFTVAMVDVDHFKAFNDRHGHDVGDQVLRLVAARLGEAGGGARAFRYGGEEFTLVWRGRSLKEVRPHLEAVCESIASADFVVRAADRPKKRPRRILPAKRPLRTLKVTVSIGAAERTERSTPADEVVRAADAALYRAKKGGRNRVIAGRA